VVLNGSTIRRLGFVAVVLALLGVPDPGRAADERTDASGGGQPHTQQYTEPPQAVVIDIRPGLCPNHLKLESALAIPVAVLGTMQFDVMNIDPGTIRLSRDGAEGECAPTKWDYADVGSPVIGSAPDCNDPRGDGLDDLVMQFPIRDLISTLGLADLSGEAVPLVLRGKIVTGKGIEGSDLVIVMSGSSGDADRRNLIGFVGEVLPGSGAGEVKFAYYTDTTDRITFAVYDPSGKIVKTLVDTDMAPGIYRATWAGIGEDGQAVPDGIYFARINNSSAGSTRKITLQR